MGQTDKEEEEEGQKDRARYSPPALPLVEEAAANRKKRNMSSGSGYEDTKRPNERLYCTGFALASMIVM